MGLMCRNRKAYFYKLLYILQHMVGTPQSYCVSFWVERIPPLSLPLSLFLSLSWLLLFLVVGALKKAMLVRFNLKIDLCLNVKTDLRLSRANITFLWLQGFLLKLNPGTKLIYFCLSIVFIASNLPIHLPTYLSACRALLSLLLTPVLSCLFHSWEMT